MNARLFGLFLLLLWLDGACAPAPPPGAVTAPLAYVGLDSQIYSIRPEGGEPRRVSVLPGEAPLPAGQRMAQWPTWSPDGSWLAFARFELSRVEADRSAIFVAGPEAAPKRVFESAVDAPIYLAWSPDSAGLVLLTQAAEGLRLWTLDRGGSAPAREVAHGGPLYLAWSPDGRSLLLHLNGDSRESDQAILALVSPDSVGPPSPLAAQPTDFRAPTWSKDGSRFAYGSALPGGQSALTVQPLDRGEPVRLASIGLEPAFLWSGVSDRLAFSSRASDQVPVYNGLETIKSDGTDRQRVTDASILAFFWSPDGKRLAYVGVDPARRALTWHVADADGKNHRELSSFLPNRDQLFLFTFFDQFAQSHGIWSPDGRFLIYSGSEAGLSTGGSPTETATGESEPPSKVYIVAADGSAPARAVADGRLGVWPVAARK